MDSLPRDPLFELERTIARRADELSQLRNGGRQYSLMHWLEAENEICRAYNWSSHTDNGPSAQSSLSPFDNREPEQVSRRHGIAH
jgi:hypothetical protein